METVANNCAECSSPGKQKCSGCNNVWYCSKEHQKKHWTAHRDACKPYLIKTNDIFGRYLVASKDIKQGELILKEKASVIGPQIQSAPLCLNCYKPISKSIYSCQICKVAPLCTLSCDADGHSAEECKAFQQSKLTMKDLIDNYQIVMPLRCLLLKNDGVLWRRLMEMEAHMDKRRNTPIWRSHKSNIEDVLIRQDVLTEEDVTDEVIQRICGILDVNTFELRSKGFGQADCIRGVYIIAALMAHDCTGNTHLAIDDDYNMIIHASVPIAKGTPIYFSYTSALKSTSERQEHLREGKYFNCDCKRCRDPTEFGTNLSALNCVKCCKGLIVPLRGDIWKCNEQKCGYEYKDMLIHSTIYETRNQIEDADKSDIQSMENLLKKLLLTFPSQHSLIIELKRSLSQLYSNILRIDANPTSAVLRRKLQLCQEMLPVVEKLEPGISRTKGLLYYEAHLPMVVLANRDYENGNISPEVLLKRLQEAEEALKKAISLLLYEPNASPEGRLAVQAMTELKYLRESLKSVVDLSAHQKRQKKSKKKT